MHFDRRDPVGARTGGCEQGFSNDLSSLYYTYKRIHVDKA